MPPFHALVNSCRPILASKIDRIKKNSRQTILKQANSGSDFRSLGWVCLLICLFNEISGVHLRRVREQVPSQRCRTLHRCQVSIAWNCVAQALQQDPARSRRKHPATSDSLNRRPQKANAAPRTGGAARVSGRRSLQVDSHSTIKFSVQEQEASNTSFVFRAEHSRRTGAKTGRSRIQSKTNRPTAEEAQRWQEGIQATNQAAVVETRNDRGISEVVTAKTMSRKSFV